MNFNSFYFFGFLAVVLLLYRLLPWKYGRVAMVAGSYFFYGNANPLYCILLLLSTTVDYVLAGKIEQETVQKRKKFLLLISVFTNIGLLAFFKYGDFFINNWNTAFSFYDSYQLATMNLELPVGISFYTFQTLSYTIDVYRGRTKANKDPIQFALFVAYFPQLVAGPIERAGALLPQLDKKHKVSGAQFMHGMERVLWGLVKKTVFADRLAVFVNEVYQNPEAMPAPVLIFVMGGFLFVLYLDFSAYTDIAIGTARMMGVKLSENFVHPFAVRNPAQFWTRWHITLTRWFMDYVFQPIGGVVRNNVLRTIFNTLFVMTLIGFWHGASWNFVLFGFIAGLTSISYQILRMRKSKSSGRGSSSLFGKGPWAWLGGFVINSIFLYPIGVFFRAPDLEVAMQVFKGSIFNAWEVPSYYYLYFGLIILMFFTHVIRGKYVPAIRSGERTIEYPRTMTNFLLILLLLFGAYDYQETFIYFQF